MKDVLFFTFLVLATCGLAFLAGCTFSDECFRNLMEIVL